MTGRARDQPAPAHDRPDQPSHRAGDEQLQLIALLAPEHARLPSRESSAAQGNQPKEGSSTAPASTSGGTCSPTPAGWTARRRRLHRHRLRPEQCRDGQAAMAPGLPATTCPPPWRPSIPISTPSSTDTTTTATRSPCRPDTGTVPPIHQRRIPTVSHLLIPDIALTSSSTGAKAEARRHCHVNRCGGMCDRIGHAAHLLRPPPLPA
jgi:hypothetical protein